jgi:carbonic anhydrase
VTGDEGSDGPPETELERVLAANRRYADSFAHGDLRSAPSSGLAILACIDARLNVERAFGLRTGDAHIVRNAGALATDDAIRSIVISQELFGTDRVLVVGHTRCGLMGRTDADIRHGLVERTGSDVAMAFGTFADLEASVRAQVERLRAHPWIRNVPIHGLIYDVETGRLSEVS